jgi:hypothetical protein
VIRNESLEDEELVWSRHNYETDSAAVFCFLSNFKEFHNFFFAYKDNDKKLKPFSKIYIDGNVGTLLKPKLISQMKISEIP